MLEVQKQKAITLIALVVTIVILLILAGVTIATLMGENGLIENIEKAKLENMKAEAKEDIEMAIIQIQTEKILQNIDVTHTVLNENLNNVNSKIQPKDYKEGNTQLKGIYTTSNGTKFNFIIDEKLNVKIEVVEEGDFPITVSDVETTSLRLTGDVSKLNTSIANYTYVAQTSTSNQIKFENIIDTSYTVTGLEPGTEYDVYMLAYDNAGNVMKSNVETVKTQEIEIETTEAYIGTSTTITDASKSVSNNSQTKGKTLYINFTATANISGVTCTISPNLPYAITKNGTYKFIITANYGSYTKTIEKEVVVKKYDAALNLVKYDAGEWTKEEIEELKGLSLYDINLSKSSSLSMEFTFGGFTYREDKDNEEYINNGLVLTNRNQSVSWAKYNGWQILEIKDSNGNIIKNETQINEKIDNLENEKIYVTKLVHAGMTETFNLAGSSKGGVKAAYILSGGARYQEYSTTYNARDWSMYKDKKQLDLIEDVHVMTYQEAYDITGDTNTTTGLRSTGGWYYLPEPCSDEYSADAFLWVVKSEGQFGSRWRHNAFAIRPVVSLKDGVYIASGDGTEGNEYVLAME